MDCTLSLSISSVSYSSTVFTSGLASGVSDGIRTVRFTSLAALMRAFTRCIPMFTCAVPSVSERPRGEEGAPLRFIPRSAERFCRRALRTSVSDSTKSPRTTLMVCSDV
jgi:hypothetical protein